MFVMESSYEVDDLSFCLDIETTQQLVSMSPHSNMLNEKLPPSATIIAINSTEPTIYPIDKDEDPHELTDDELDEIMFAMPSITISQGYGSDETITKVEAPNGKIFTVQDLVDAVVAIERNERPKRQWFGGIDCHHIFFEGSGDRERGEVLVHRGR